MSASNVRVVLPYGELQPSGRSKAFECEKPDETAFQRVSVPTWTGVVLGVTDCVPIPSWPMMLSPQHQISRGIHPAILSKGGLGPALKTLIRRSALPVELELRAADRRLPERVEVAAYYIVSEALTNAAKHAHASVVEVDVTTEDALLLLSIRDDGVGGADAGRGSGLIGLQDRVETLGGTIEITGGPGGGTTILAKIPIDGKDEPDG